MVTYLYSAVRNVKTKNCINNVSVERYVHSVSLLRGAYKNTCEKLYKWNSLVGLSLQKLQKKLLMTFHNLKRGQLQVSSIIMYLNVINLIKRLYFINFLQYLEVV